MKAVAYCRVSTNKEEQLDSLESQQNFFAEYAQKNQLELIHIYADEGKSGTKMKNRTELLRMLSDSKKNLFQVVLIKDVSRLARNTVDFLTSIRSLKALGIKVVFVNYDQTSSDSSEFMLTMLSAIAQEESANTSKRVKFGKKQNAEKGRVPNLVYGYDKVIGEYFSLAINQEEAAVVKRIFYLYTEKNMGAARIAKELNQDGIKTKRNCKWSQIAISRILSNPIYIGKVINGKQEVTDFLTGKRKEVDEKDWLIVHNQQLAIIEETTFYKAQRLLQSRQNAFLQTGRRTSNKHVLSQLLSCKECGSSYRKLVRKYKNTYVTWVCNGRNSKGVDFCNNQISIDEKELLYVIKEYMDSFLLMDVNITFQIVKEMKHMYTMKEKRSMNEKEYASLVRKLNKERQKYIEMYTNDIITMEELLEETKRIQNALENIQKKRVELDFSHFSKMNDHILQEINDKTRIEWLTNEMLKKVIEKIEVNSSGNVDIYLRSF